MEGMYTQPTDTSNIIHPTMTLNDSGGRPLFGFDDIQWSQPPPPQVHYHSHTKATNTDAVLVSIIPNSDRAARKTICRSVSISPGYKADDKFLICLYVPGIKAKDMAVQVEQDGKVLYVAGRRTVVSKDGFKPQTMKFWKRFRIGTHMDVDRMTAHLANGVLTLTAPVKDKVTTFVRTIAIEDESKTPKENTNDDMWRDMDRLCCGDACYATQQRLDGIFYR